MNIINLLKKSSTTTGQFRLPSGDKVEGQLIFNSDYDHTIFLHVSTQEQKSWTHSPDLNQDVIHGILDCGRHVSLIGSTPTVSNYLSSLSYFEVGIQILLSAHSHPIPEHYTVTKIRFAISGSRKIFPIHIRQPQDKTQRQEILNAITRVFGQEFVPDDQRFSFDRVFFCAGGTELISCDSNFGQISVLPYDVTTLPYIDVEFQIEPKSGSTISDAESAIECVLRFLWLITGTRQVAENIRIQVKDHDEVTHDLDVNLMLQEAPLFSADSVISLGKSILIDPIHSRTEFEKCLSAWSKLSAKKRAACDVILSEFNEPFHRPFRIARDAVAYEWFNNSSNRSTLREKILSRLEIVEDQLPRNVQDIKKVIASAVKARNEYVHEGPHILSKQFSLSYIYMANTLEFIFLSSVLVECGWDMKSRFMGNSLPIGHPFDRYVMDYGQFNEIFNTTVIEPQKVQD